MPLNPIIVGTAPGDGTGETIRGAFIKTNANFVYVDDRITALATTVGSNLTTFTNFALTKAKPNGLASLDADGLLDESQLRASGAAAGTYGAVTPTNPASTGIPRITLDAKGRVTGITVDSIGAASLTQYGLVKLSSAVDSASDVLAATASAVKVVYDLAFTANATANAAIPATEKAAPLGVATLNASGLIPEEQSRTQYLGTQAVRAISYNAKSIDEDVTIPANVNAMSVGPITVATGFTVTISDDSNWSII